MENYKQYVVTDMAGKEIARYGYKSGAEKWLRLLEAEQPDGVHPVVVVEEDEGVAIYLVMRYELDTYHNELDYHTYPVCSFCCREAAEKFKREKLEQDTSKVFHQIEKILLKERDNEIS